MLTNRYGIAIQNGNKQIGRYTTEQDNVQLEDVDPNLDLPTHGSYAGLLFDPRWKAKRSEIVTRDGERCVICQSIYDLQVHHRQYQFIKAANAFKTPWDYPDYLLITLCKSCHQRGHSKFKVPILII